MKILTLLLSFFVIASSACTKKDNIQAVDSAISIGNLTLQRDSKIIKPFHFAVDVYPANPLEIKVNYVTRDGTAVSGKDYTAVSGTLTIPAGVTTAYIDVPVLADSLRRDDQTLTIELDSPVNGKLVSSKATGFIINQGTYLPVENTGYSASSSYEGHTLLWNDEFNGKTLNPANWVYETGGSGWGNNELEYYTNSTGNLFLTGGYLVIEAREENFGNNRYTSARIKTQDKKTFTYGRIDVRAKLPKGKGVWPAIWMLGNNISQPGSGWPACGEIDIMELLGHEPAKVYSTAHWGNSGQGSIHLGSNFSLGSGNFSDSFHLFSLEWDAGKLTFFVDDAAYFTLNKGDVTGAAYPFDNPFFFILNVAVGGNWPGAPDSSTSFPQRMIVDFVRVYK